ncbi:hypothetical protein BVC93_20455 [Mycobacterium sp. MS1601]|uniref:hypothetical protein n=1 Tax=Mycobacterium sp. MS1601 TaxID=1936029 RepID=UPI0009793C6A|nr:hypothetical protein [Mycobacterium sp. MS1601]AQA04398.1 hypothetical protein BVC93_20455 [Mycobacterium sp. MS1601]
MALTEDDLELVAVELIDIGELIVSEGADGQPSVWQVHAKKHAFNQHEGQTVELRPAAGTDQRAVAAIRAPLGTLVYRVRRSSIEAIRRSALTVPELKPDRVEESRRNRRRQRSPGADSGPRPRVSHAIRARWIDILQDARFVLDTLRHQTTHAPRPNEFTRGMGPSLWKIQPGRLVHKYEAMNLPAGCQLERALGDVVEDVREFLDQPPPWNTSQVAADLSLIIPAIDAAIGRLRLMEPDLETVSEVVDDLERDFLLSLAVTLTGQGTLAKTLAEWEQGKKGDYLDIASFRLVGEGGPGRLHMRDVHEATDAGITTYLIGQGLRSHDKYPDVQYMLYSQWFTYIYALWEESYRRRLATAHGSDSDGMPWTRFDIRSPLFGDIRNIRNDVVHKHGVVDASAGNRLLTRFSDGERIEITVEQMMSLISLFPRPELVSTPVRAQPGNLQNLPWSVAPELVDEVRQIASSRAMTRKQSRDIGNEALKLWIASHRE